MKQVLISWIGATDLRAPKESETLGVGPIAQAVEVRQYNEIVLICDYPPKRATPYIEWLKKRCPFKISINYVNLSSPTNFGEIYEAATGIIDKAINKKRDKCIEKIKKHHPELWIDNRVYIDFLDIHFKKRELSTIGKEFLVWDNFFYKCY